MMVRTSSIALLLAAGVLLKTAANAGAMPSPRLTSPTAATEAMLVCRPTGCWHMYRPYHARPSYNRYFNERFYPEVGAVRRHL